MKNYQLTTKKHLSNSEHRHLVGTLRRLPYDDRDRLLLQTALETGARAREVLGVRREDLISGNRSIFIRALKGSYDREIPLRPYLFQGLKRLGETSSTEFLFDVGYHRFREIWVWHRPVEKPLHCLRHTFAIQLYARTKDLRLVQFALGHRSINNTMIYARYHYMQGELRRAFFGKTAPGRDEPQDPWLLD